MRLEGSRPAQTSTGRPILKAKEDDDVCSKTVAAIQTRNPPSR